MSKHSPDFHRAPNWSERFAFWVIGLIPEWIVNEPERVLINGVMVLIGGFAIAQQPPQSLVAAWSHWWAIEWGVGMAGGAFLVLVGMFRKKITAMRFGLLLMFVCAAIYGIDLVWVFGLRGIFSGLTYIGIAIAKLIRLAKTTAERALLLQNQQERDANGNGNGLPE